MKSPSNADTDADIGWLRHMPTEFRHLFVLYFTPLLKEAQL